MLAVTTGLAIRERLRDVSVALKLPHPVFAERVRQALQLWTHEPVLFLDLGMPEPRKGTDRRAS